MTQLAESGGLLFTALSMGFLGSTHCVGMCGGISSALSFALPTEARQGWRLPAYQLLYNGGRILTYSLLGSLLGLMGEALLGHWGSTIWPRELAAVVMVVLGLYLAGIWRGLQRLEKMGGGLWRYLQPLSRRLLPVDNPLKAICAGAVWGFLPCGLVYSGLGLALTAADAQGSALVMLAFGLGTLPTLLVTGSLAGGVRRVMQAPATRRIAGLMVVAFGLWTGAMAWYHQQMSAADMAAMPGMSMPAAPQPASTADSAPAAPAASSGKALMDDMQGDMKGMDMSDMDMKGMNMKQAAGSAPQK